MEAKGRKLAVFFDGQYLISVDNLSKDLEPKFSSLQRQKLSPGQLRELSFKQLREQLCGHVRLERIDREGNQRDQDIFEGRIENVEEGRDYAPIIPILLFPTILQFLAPAVSVPEMVHYIQQQYEEHFGKVRNRLPLHIGVVVFKQHFPLYQAMNAAERMMSALQKRSDKI